MVTTHRELRGLDTKGNEGIIFLLIFLFKAAMQHNHKPFQMEILLGMPLKVNPSSLEG